MSTPVLQSKDVQLAMMTWAELKVKEPDVDGFVLSVLVKYLEKNPDMQYLFKAIANKPIEEVKTNKKFAKHAHKFATSLDTVVQHLTAGEQHQELCADLKKLGKIHSDLGIRSYHYTPVGETLVGSLKETLGSSFTEEVQGAWVAVFGVVVSLMTVGETKQKQAQANLSAEHIAVETTTTRL